MCLLAGCDKLFGLSEITDDAGRADTGHVDTGQPDAADPNGPQVYYTARASMTDIDVPFANPPPAGALIVVMVATYQNVLDNVTDNANNIYTATPIDPSTSPGGSQLWVLYAANALTTTGFNVHITTHATSAEPDTNETTAVVLAYPGPFSASPLDLADSRSSQGTGNPVVQDCGSLTTAPGEIVLAGVSHDFTGVTSAGPGCQLRAIAAEGYLRYATLAVEDEAATADATEPTFSTTYQTGNVAWVCATVTFR